MVNKTVEQMVAEVSEKNSFYTRDNNGYCGMSVESTFPSTKKTAIVYQTTGSNWNRGGPTSSGISYFQGTGVYNGTVDLTVKPHCQWRSGTNYADDCPSARYSVKSFRDLDSGKYELVLVNCNGEERMEVDFKSKELKHKP